MASGSAYPVPDDGRSVRARLLANDYGVRAANVE